MNGSADIQANGMCNSFMKSWIWTFPIHERLRRVLHVILKGIKILADFMSIGIRAAAHVYMRHFVVTIDEIF